ncbi:MAG: outer membrane beta-barrel protein [Chitinophagaceae bacterium]
MKVSYAQFTVSGSVTDTAGKPVAYATIKLFQPGSARLYNSTLTDVNGAYTFSKLPQGNYLIKISMVGYRSDSAGISAGPQQEASPYNYILRTSATNLAAVNVVSKKQFIEKRPDRLVVNLENSIIAAGSSMWDAMEKLPAVEISGDDISVLGKSGVVIYVDDKPSYLSGSQLSAFLKSMPSGQVSRIEIITNPSAKYDAAGGSIINIITKKTKVGGWTADLTLSQAQGRYPKSDPSASFTYNAKKWSANASMGFSYAYDYLTRPAYVKYRDQAAITFFDQDQFTKSLNKSASYMAGFDYYFNANNSIGLTVRAIDNNRKDNYSGKTMIYSPSFDSIINTASARRFKNHLYLYTLNYKTKPDSTSSVNMDLNYGQFITNNTQAYNFSFLYPNNDIIRPAEFFNNEVPSTVTITAGTLDYSKKITKTFSLDAGIKSTITKSNSAIFYSQLKNGNWIADGSRDNSFGYKEKIYAAYVSINKSYKYFSMQLGARTEVMNARGSSDNNINVKRNYTQLFPSFTLHYSRKPASQWDLSYSTRVARPNFNYLNPFPVQFDPYTSQVGNAFLVPSYTNTLELAHTFKKKYIVALSYENIRDRIENSVQQNNVTKQLENVIVNIEHCYYYRLYFILPFAITKWWTSNNTFNSYIIEYKTTILNGLYHKSKPVFYINSQNSFTLSKKVNAELTVYYRTPSLNGLFEVGERFFTDAGVRINLIPNKSSLRISVNDIFYTNRWEWSIDHNDQYSGFTTIRDTRLIRLTYNRKFGGSKISRSVRRRTGVEEEQDRLR